jgi:hypothetical protein
VRFRLADCTGAVAERFSKSLTRDQCHLRILGQGQVLGELRDLPAGVVTGDAVQKAADFIQDLVRDRQSASPAPRRGDPRVSGRCPHCGAPGQAGEQCVYCRVGVVA